MRNQLPHLETKHVFIDTSVYRKLNFVDNHQLSKLQELAERDVVRLHITDITLGEVQSKLKAEEATLLRKIESSFLPRVSDNDELLGAIEGLRANENSDSIFREFKSFLNTCGCEYHSLEHSSPKDVFVRYFAEQPPFSSKKKSEFPDAFVADMLDLWCSESECQMYIVSEDPDFQDICDDFDDFIYLNSLEQFLELAGNFSSEVTEAVNVWIQDHKTEVIDTLRPLLSDAKYTVSGQPEAEVLYVLIPSIDLQDHFILDFDVDEVTVILDFGFDVDAEILYIDVRDIGTYDERYLQTMVTSEHEGQASLTLRVIDHTATSLVAVNFHWPKIITLPMPSRKTP